FGSGIWAGVVFIVTGVLGLASSSKSRALIVSYLVMSIISSVFAAMAIIITGFGIADTAGYGYYYQANDTAVVVNQVFNVLLLIVLLVEGIIAIVGSAFGCCSGLCC
ncbi:CD20-like domain-containing protein, partial [Salmonella sp. s55004]|uniref:CD20-like domain-containing protein n=1 Tax=Salmonella sp. s55004 TaxID=3159675 RepID=UPI00397EED7C